ERPQPLIRSLLGVSQLFAVCLRFRTNDLTNPPSMPATLVKLSATIRSLLLLKLRDAFEPLATYHSQTQHCLLVKNLTMRGLDHIHSLYMEKLVKLRPRLKNTLLHSRSSSDLQTFVSII